MVYIFICVDFDRDYAFPIVGLKHAISKPIQLKSSKEQSLNPIESISIKGTVNCFNPFMTYLSDKELQTTFYFEARSAKLFSEKYPKEMKMFKKSSFEFGVHGYDHEDFTGEETRVRFEQDEERNIIASAKREIENLFSTDIVGFRAPYMRITSNTLQILSALNFTHDSSYYKEAERAIYPFRTKEGLVEFPVIKTPKESSMKGMYTYLWPFFEKKRTLEEIIGNYIHLLKNTEDKNSYISINLHLWHFAYNIEHNRFLLQEEIAENIHSFKKLITSLEKGENVTFSTPSEWLKENSIV